MIYEHFSHNINYGIFIFQIFMKPGVYCILFYDKIVHGSVD